MCIDCFCTYCTNKLKVKFRSFQIAALLNLSKSVSDTFESSNNVYFQISCVCIIYVLSDRYNALSYGDTEICLSHRNFKFGCVLVFYRPLKKGRNFVFGCVLVFPFFSRKLGTTKKITGLGCGKNHIRTLAVVIRTTFKDFNKFFPVSRNTGLKFLIFCLISSE